MIKGVIMDLDGTILDSMGIWDDVGPRFLETQGKTEKDDFKEKVYSMTLEESSEYIRKEYDLSLSVKEIEAGVLDIIQDFYFDEVQLKPGALKLLKVIHELSIPIVAATSSERDQIEHAFSRLKISDYFNRIFTCSEVGEGKRFPKIYLEAAEFMGKSDFAPEDYLVFEDALFAIETAGNAGFKTAAVYDKTSQSGWLTIKAKSDFYLLGNESENEIKEKILGI